MQPSRLTYFTAFALFASLAAPLLRFQSRSSGRWDDRHARECQQRGLGGRRRVPVRKYERACGTLGGRALGPRDIRRPKQRGRLAKQKQSGRDCRDCRNLGGESFAGKLELRAGEFSDHYEPSLPRLCLEGRRDVGAANTGRL